MDTAQVEVSSKFPVSYGANSLPPVERLHRGLSRAVSTHLGEQVKASDLKPVELKHPLNNIDPAWVRTATTPDAELELDQISIDEEGANKEPGTSPSGLFLKKVKERIRQTLSRGNKVI